MLPESLGATCCGNTYYNTVEWARHLKSDCREPQLVCPHCQLPTKTEPALKAHLWKTHNYFPGLTLGQLASQVLPEYLRIARVREQNEASVPSPSVSVSVGTKIVQNEPPAVPLPSSVPVKTKILQNEPPSDPFPSVSVPVKTKTGKTKIVRVFLRQKQ